MEKYKKKSKESEISRKEKEFRERSQANGVEGSGGNWGRPASVPSLRGRKPTDVRDNGAYQFLPHGVAESGDSASRRDEARSILVRLLARHVLSLHRTDDRTEAA